MQTIRKFSAVIAIVVMASFVSGCISDNPDGTRPTSFSQWLTNVGNKVNLYAPLIGKNLLLIVNIVVQAECSPIIPAGGQIAVNVLNIVAPDSRSAQKVSDALAKNALITAQLCPLYQSIKASVGTVPQGVPTQTVIVPAS